MWSADSYGKSANDKPICVRGDHSGNHYLHGDRIILYLVGGGLWLSHRPGVLVAG